MNLSDLVLEGASFLLGFIEQLYGVFEWWNKLHTDELIHCIVLYCTHKFI